MIHKTYSYVKKDYSFGVPAGSKLIKFLTWFDNNRKVIRAESTLKGAIKDSIKGYLHQVTKQKDDWTSKVFRCFRASEFVFRWKEWEIIKANNKHTVEDVGPENPLQHTSLATTLRHYANAASQAEGGAEARITA